MAEIVPVWGLARTPFGYVLLDRKGLVAWHQRLTGAVEGAPRDLLSRFQRGLSKNAQSAQTDVRKLAVARCVPQGLSRMLRSRLPTGIAYINTGHSNLSLRVLNAVREVRQARISVFIHDVIPLDYPQYQRPGSVAVFEQKMQRVRDFADLLIYNSEDTRNRTQAVMSGWGAVPQGIVAHLGTVLPEPDDSDFPIGLPPEGPYFITVGTIEPRKNHKMLLDLWEKLGADAPVLLICGARGWNNDAVFGRLDALEPNARVREVTGLADGALMALIQGAHGMLFPSHAEGFGLPAIEALQLGTPVMCSNIATFRETLAKSAIYIDNSAQDIWEETVVNWSKQARDTFRVRDFEAPTWEAHFKIALSFT